MCGERLWWIAGFLTSPERERELIARMDCSRDRAAEMGDGSEKLASNTREPERERNCGE